MALVVSVNTKEYEKPQEGVALGVLADVADLGMVDGFYGAKPKVRLTWVIDQKDTEGNFFVISKTYTASMHEKATLYADVKDILGSVPPVPYDIELLIGRVNTLVLKKETATQGKYAGKDFVNIKAFLAARSGDKLVIPADYVREKDGGVYGRARQNNQGNNTQQAPRTPAPQPRTSAPAQQNTKPVAPEVADEDIPF